MEFCSIQCCDEKTIAALLCVYAQSTGEIYKKQYEGRYDSDEYARAALLQDYSDFIEEFITQDDRYIFAVKEHGEYIAALRIIQMSESGWYIEALETSPEYRRMGFARYLLKQTLRCMRTLGAKTIISVIGNDNLASHGLHTACGFENTGKIPRDIEGIPVGNCRVFEYVY